MVFDTVRYLCFRLKHVYVILMMLLEVFQEYPRVRGRASMCLHGLYLLYPDIGWEASLLAREQYHLTLPSAGVTGVDAGIAIRLCAGRQVSV